MRMFRAEAIERIAAPMAAEATLRGLDEIPAACVVAAVARDGALQDFLDFKQFVILGETFLRCEPFDIDDFVAILKRAASEGEA